jgi:hypothetical protein
MKRETSKRGKFERKGKREKKDRGKIEVSGKIKD